jgi:two-component system, NarL family, invasion response regulator UvrY
MSSESAITIALIDPYPVVREMIQVLIDRNPSMVLVVSAGTVAEAIEQMRACAPIDVCVLEILLVDGNGLEVLTWIRESYPNTHVVIYTAAEEGQFGAICIRHGASGFVSKRTSLLELQMAVETVHRGQLVVSAHLATELIRTQGNKGLAHSALSSREWEVFSRLARGRKNAEISRELSLDQRTVSSYRRRVLDKLNVSSEADLVVYAIQHGLLGGANGGMGAPMGWGRPEAIGDQMVSVWSSLAERLPVAVIVTDLEGIVTHWSPHAEALYGWTQEETLGENIRDLTVTDQTSMEAEEAFAQLLAGKSWDGEFVANTKSGAEVRVRVVDVPVLNQRNELSAICGISFEA